MRESPTKREEHSFQVLDAFLSNVGGRSAINGWGDVTGKGMPNRLASSATPK